MTQLQLLLGDCGESLDSNLGKELMLYHNDHQRVLTALKRRFARKEFGRKPDVAPCLNDLDNIHKESFLPWFMSGRPSASTEGRLLERQMIWIKNRLKRFARDGVKTAAFLWRHLMYGIKRGLLFPQVFVPRKQELGRYEIGFKMGRGDNLGGGMTITGKWQQLDNDSNVRKRMKMPTSCGLAFSMDLLIDHEASQGMINGAIGSLKRLITEHFEADIVNLPRFLNWQVS